MDNDLSAQIAHQNFHVMTVITEQNRQPNQDPHRIRREQARLEHADRVAEQLGKLADQVDQAVDDPLVPPHGNPGKDTSERGSAVDAETVNDFGVEKSERGAEVLDAVYEQCVVEFVDVILINEKLVKARPRSGDLGVQVRELQVETVGEPDTESGNSHGNRHQEKFDDQGMMRELNCASFRNYAAQNRFEEFLERAFATPKSRESDPAADDGEERENREGNGHRFGRFMDVLLHLVGNAREPKESQVKEPEHIEGGQAGREQADDPEGQITVEHGGAGDGSSEDFVFAEETGERGHTSNGQRGDQERAGGGRDGIPQAAHFAQILFAGECVNHAAGTEEEQSLEEGVRHEMKNACCKGADSKGEKHVAELADGGIGEDLLDVGLSKSHSGGEDSGEGSDDGDDVHRNGSKLIDGVHASDHVNTGGDHRGGVDKRADRRWTFNRIGEPDVERKLGGLAGWADKEEQGDHGEHGSAVSEVALVHHGGEHLQNAGKGSRVGQTQRCEANGTKGGGDEENAEQEAGIADTIHDESFFACV